MTSLPSPAASTLIARLPPVRGRLSAEYPLAKIAWFAVGGPADVLFKPADEDDLAAFLAAKPDDIPLTVVGVGSNLLVRDRGVRGVVVRLGRSFASVKIRENTVKAGAAALDQSIAQAAAEAGIGGLEFLSGIPGSLGGAVKMNAGAFGREMKDVLVSIEVLDPRGRRCSLSPVDLKLSYRCSALPEGWIVIGALLKGDFKDRAAIEADMEKIRQTRLDSQPTHVRTGGSTFANPEGHKAWKLIDRAGCRGMRRGGAMVSEKHCNFLINTGGAVAADLEALGEEVRLRVKEAFDIDLRWEILRLGEADESPLPPKTAAATVHAALAPSSPPPSLPPPSSPPPFLPPSLAAEVAGVLERRRFKQVTVLMGGPSAEREVSLSSGAAVAQALKESGYAVHPLDITRDLGLLCRRLEQDRPEAVFNALHGRYGEDGCVQGILNILDIPYTHSGLLASALAMDKTAAKNLFAQAGIPIAPGVLVRREDLLKGDPLPRPYVLKPHNEGSSVGVLIVRERDHVNPADFPWPYGPLALAESFVPGRELTVGVMGDRVLGITEIQTDRCFYDYEAKYVHGGSKHVLPALLEAERCAEIEEYALKAHRVLGCRGVSRADFRFDGEKAVILEVNTQPGLTATSLVPEQAALAGISFPDLCAWMVETAACDP